MATQEQPARSRRAVIAGGFGAMTALAAQALAGPSGTQAAGSTDPNALHKETNNPTTAQTTVTAAGATAIKGVSNASSGKHAGVLGQSVPGDGRGVVGLGPIGVLGQTGSPTGFGTWGLATGAAAIGVLGRNLATSGDAYGVKGESHSDSGSGVFGIATSTAGAGVEGKADGVGVFGHSDAASGIGVQGTGGAFGVRGFGTEATAVGVYGKTEGATGIAGQFEASGAAGSFGISVLGRAEFSTAGVASCASGVSQKTVTPGVELTSNTKVLATLQSDAGGATVAWVEVSTGPDTFTVHFTAATGQACSVAWFVIG